MNKKRSVSTTLIIKKLVQINRDLTKKCSIPIQHRAFTNQKNSDLTRKIQIFAVSIQ